MDEDFRGRDAAAAGVLHNAAKCAAKFLRREFQRPSTGQQKIKAKNFVHLTKKPTHKEEAKTRLRFKMRGRHLGDLLPKIRAEVYMIFVVCGEGEAWQR